MAYVITGQIVKSQKHLLEHFRTQLVINSEPVLANNWNYSCGYNIITSATTCAGKVKGPDGEMVTRGKPSNVA